MKFSLARTIRFIGIGGFSTAVYWVGLLVLTYQLHLKPIAASVTAFGLGFLTAYIGHRTVTYRSRAFMGPELARFLTVQIICFGLGNLAFWITVARLGLSVAIGGALLTLISVVTSFVAYEKWVFTPPR